ncbi:MAG: hypothetical protein ACU85V_19660 [Gammaproteobacteria bacterium]
MITLLVALPSEARPLVEHFALASAADAPFRVHRRDDLRLIVSGVGAAAAAAAIGYAAGIEAARPGDAWLNVGIAGHASLAPGTAVRAGRVSAAHGEKRWYPHVGGPDGLPVTDVVTVPAPTTDYPGNACVDMEAAGFMAATARVAGSDFVSVLKIVSDNAASGLGHIDRQYVSNLVADACEAVAASIETLRAGAARLPATPDPAVAEMLLEATRFSFTQRQRLGELLCRCVALGVLPEPAALARSGDAARILAALEAAIVAATPRFAP